LHGRVAIRNKNLQQCCFAGTRGSENANDLTVFDRQGDNAKNPVFAVSF
jgi:hypothetical protein